MFFSVMLWTIILSAAIVGFVLLFLRAYEQQQKKGASLAVAQLVAEGNKLYSANDWEGAARKYEQALQQGPDTEPGKTARTNLAITYNRLGQSAFEHRDLKAAEDYWYRVLDIDPNHADAHYNLGRLYDRLGDRDRALREWQISKEGGRVGGENPAAPGNATTFQSRYESARLYYNTGMEAYTQGDVETARDKWQKAVGEAPGTDIANNAQQMLDRTTSQPNF